MKIFELGVRDSDERGSGIGMYDVRKRLEDMKATIVFNGNNVKLKGASFKNRILVMGHQSKNRIILFCFLMMKINKKNLLIQNNQNSRM